MSIEFVAEIAMAMALEADGVGLKWIADELGRDPTYELLGHGHDWLALRIAAHSPRPNWQRDVELVVSVNSLRVVFHSANAGERAALLARLREMLFVEE